MLSCGAPVQQNENERSSPQRIFVMTFIPLFWSQFPIALLRYVFHCCITSGISRYKLKSGVITPLNLFKIGKSFQSLHHPHKSEQNSHNQCCLLILRMGLAYQVLKNKVRYLVFQVLIQKWHFLLKMHEKHLCTHFECY